MSSLKNKYFLKFAVVGCGGFVVDISVTFILSQFMLAEVARGAAFWVAASSNWWLNRQFTFSSAQRRQPLKQWLHFLSASSIGFVPNWGCYWILINSDLERTASSLLSVDLSAWWPYGAMIPGILLGMVVNFILSSRWVFRLAVTR